MDLAILGYHYRLPLSVMENMPWDELLLMARAVAAVHDPEHYGRKGR